MNFAGVPISVKQKFTDFIAKRFPPDCGISSERSSDITAPRHPFFRTRHGYLRTFHTQLYRTASVRIAARPNSSFISLKYFLSTFAIVSAVVLKRQLSSGTPGIFMRASLPKPHIS